MTRPVNERTPASCGRREFDAELDGTQVGCRLDVPKQRPDKKPHPAVLLCAGAPAADEPTAELHARIAESLVAAGVAAAAILGPRDGPVAGLAQAVDDAAAVLHSLAVRPEVDVNRIGVLGHGLGAIVAACLSARSDQIAALCLLTPVTPATITSRLGGSSAADLAARLGALDAPEGFFNDLASLSPLQDAARYDRPTLILHGAADRTVPPAAAAEYAAVLGAAGHRVEFAQVALADFLFSAPAPRAACLDQVVRFFAAMARPPVAAGMP